MAPGALSILAPFLGRGKAKRYEKLETEDPERRRQEATQEEINRLNCKIVSHTTRAKQEFPWATKGTHILLKAFTFHAKRPPQVAPVKANGKSYSRPRSFASCSWGLILSLL